MSTPATLGRPGSDAAGVVSDIRSSAPFFAHGSRVLGFCHAPLASQSLSEAALLALKPATISFDQASSLPAACTTAHIALSRASVHARHSVTIQATAGGVGLVALGYTCRLAALVLGTAGSTHKHAQLMFSGPLPAVQLAQQLCVCYGSRLTPRWPSVARHAQ